MVKPWISYTQISDCEYEVENDLQIYDIDEDPPVLPVKFVRFMQKLDGKTNPYKIDPSIDRKTVAKFLAFLSQQGFLRDKVRNRDLGRFVFSIVQFDGKPVYSRTSVLLNRLLSWLWLPVLLVGFYVCSNIADSIFDDYEYTYLFGILFGVIAGINVHEAAHIIAAKAYRAPVYEVGFKISILPIAYSFMKESEVKSRLKRANIYFAGVKSNFLLAGFFWILMCFFPNDTIREFLHYAAIQNVLMGVINLFFFFPLDGFKIVSTLVGDDYMAWSMTMLFIYPKDWVDLTRKGAPGVAQCVCYLIMIILQTICIIWIIFNIADLVEAFR